MVKKILIFITHATLSYEHANMTFYSLANSKNPIEFDEIILYNTHQDEFSMESLLDLFNSYDLKFIKAVNIFKYDENTPKTLGGDLKALSQYCNSTYDKHDHILLLKSDCLLSINFLDELHKFDKFNKDFVFVAPLVNAKRSVTDEELKEYINLPYAILSSENTFYIEDEVRSADNDFRNRPDITPDDDRIKYMSGEVKRDWSCHYLPVHIFNRVKMVSQNWGGSSFEHLQPLWIGAYKSFVVHKYHSIVSKHRLTERPGAWGEWLNG